MREAVLFDPGRNFSRNTDAVGRGEKRTPAQSTRMAESTLEINRRQRSVELVHP